jgi:hypothetical protein
MLHPLPWVGFGFCAKLTSTKSHQEVNEVYETDCNSVTDCFTTGLIQF